MLNEGGTGDHNDTVDIVFQSVQKTIDVTDADGKITKTQVMDDLSLWCKTLMVGSNTLGQTIFEMMEFMRNGFLAYTNMPKERAELWVGEVQEIVESVKKTLDSKSSESIRNFQMIWNQVSS